MTIILKGGGYGGHHIGGAVGVRLRHHYWTGTTDLPRSPVPPPDGGLEKRPGWWTRFVNWQRFIRTQLKREYAMWREGKNPKEPPLSGKWM